MKVRRTRTPFLLLPLVLVATAACDIAIADHSEKATAEWRKTYQLEPGGRVEIRNVNGKITVTPGEGNTVEIVAVKTGRGATLDAAKEALGRVEIRETAEAAHVKIETRVERSGVFNHGGTQVEYTVRMPAGAHLQAVTVNGGVEIAGIDGKVVAEATNGGIKARELGGPVEASTTNGGVDVEVTTITGDGVKLECTNGGIDLRLPADARASISARVTNGGIDTGNLPVQLRGEASRRRLDGDLNGGGPRISLEGTNGGIRLSAR